MANGDNPSEEHAMPLWRHVKMMDGSGPHCAENLRWFQCCYCNSMFRGSYSLVKAHLLRVNRHGVRACPEVTGVIFAQLRSELIATNDSIPNIMLTRMPLIQSASMSRGKKRKKNKAAGSDYCMESRDQFDDIYARMFYSSGLSFDFARNPYFECSVSRVVKNIFPGYVPPDCNKLKSTLLQQERAHVEDVLEILKGLWSGAGVTIVSDGWSDVERQPYINILAVNENQSFLMEAVNNEDEVKTKEYVAEKLIAVIEDVGPENIVQVITDNDSVCRGAGELIEQKYNHIQWAPSVAHTLSLALDTICAAKNTENGAFKDCHWISEVVEDASMIKSFLMNHTMASSMPDDFSKLKMLAIEDTIFSSDVVMLKRFQLIKQSLVRMATNDDWSRHRTDDVGKAQLMMKKLTDDSWWDQVDCALAVTEPIYSMIRMTHTENPSLHSIYEMWKDMTEKVKAAIYRYKAKELEEASEFYSAMHGILVYWWDNSKTPLQSIAHALNPRYYIECWNNKDANSIHPYYNKEISDMRNSYLKKLFPAKDDLREIKREYADFANLDPKRFSLDSIADRTVLNPLAWWANHGASTPKLQDLALKVLRQPISTSCHERSWDTSGFIYDVMKKKHRPKWAEDLMFVHTNLQLLYGKS